MIKYFINKIADIESEILRNKISFLEKKGYHFRSIGPDKYREKIEVSFRDYLKEVKIKNIIRHLCNTPEKPLKEIAIEFEKDYIYEHELSYYRGPAYTTIFIPINQICM